MDTSIVTVVLPSLITGVLTYLATRVSSKANLEQTNTENAQKLYLKYEQINQELTHKIDQLEEEVQKTAKTYQEEVLVYQGKLATAQSERDFLRAENQVLKELQRVNQVPVAREEKQHSAVG